MAKGKSNGPCSYCDRPVECIYRRGFLYFCRPICANMHAIEEAERQWDWDRQEAVLAELEHEDAGGGESHGM
jgi:hypothetical protein